MLSIELRSIAERIYTNDDDTRHYGVGILSILTFPGGVVKTNDFVSPINPEFNRATAEVLAAVASLQSVKDEYRKSGKTVFYTASRYIWRILIRKPNGDWYLQCIKNAELINKLRSLFLTYSNITVKKDLKRCKPLYELFSSIKGKK